jgi:hypothetical protein
VPPFSSFATDPSLPNELPPSGTLGGVGFRAGALPIILVATDTGWAFEPDSLSTITGLGGVTEPASLLESDANDPFPPHDGDFRENPTTGPLGASATVQGTVNALNKLGALVIGLGVGTDTTNAPRSNLSALAKLTGAINDTSTAIPDGSGGMINPGDPFYFPIQEGSSSFATTIAAGIEAAVNSAVTSVKFDINVVVTDSSIGFTNLTGPVLGVSPGGTAGFDVKFTGDGSTHTFELDFVRNGTSLVLGSIPVTITGTGTAAPAVLTNPTSVTVSAGQTATFTASASGSPTPTVQWEVSTDGGHTFTAISGATSTTLSVPNAQLTDSGKEYEAVFTNSVGSATTTAATLTVTPPLIAPSIVTNPAGVTVHAGETAVFTAAATGNPVPTVQWEVSIDGGHTFTLIPGATTTTLTVPGAQLTDNGTEYAAVFTNSKGSATTAAAILTVIPPLVPPSVIASPVSVTLTAGGTAVFTAAATGNPGPSVQWFVSHGGGPFTPIPGATGTTLIVPNVQSSDSGSEYEAVFSNGVGSATTAAASLTVTQTKNKRHHQKPKPKPKPKHHQKPHHHSEGRGGDIIS